MSIGYDLEKQDCNKTATQLKEKFRYPEEIIGFELQPLNLITDDAHKDCIVDWALYLNPKREKRVIETPSGPRERLMTGDNAFIKFSKEPERKKFMDELKSNIQNDGIECAESIARLAYVNLYGKGVNLVS